ncbi:hypothetical protein [Sporolactobacillus putidus]|nr:hypothetical protein [Sporolactobacillus putidus]
MPKSWAADEAIEAAGSPEVRRFLMRSAINMGVDNPKVQEYFDK